MLYAAKPVSVEMPSESPGFRGLRANSTGSSRSTTRLQTPCQPDDIVRDLQQLQISQSRTSKVQRFIKKTKSLVHVVNHYAKAIDIASNACPEILCPLWAPLRALLNVSSMVWGCGPTDRCRLTDRFQMAVVVDGYFCRLTDMLQQIADVLPRYHIYDQLFSKHEPVQRAISQAYSAIMTFVFQATKVFQSSSTVLRSSLWETFEQKFEGSLDQLRKHTESVERAADVAHMIEESKARDDLNNVKTELACVRAQLDRLQLTTRFGEQSAWPPSAEPSLVTRS